MYNLTVFAATTRVVLTLYNDIIVSTLLLAQNETLLFDNWWPEFSDCFQDTVLTFVPCGWLCLTSLAHFLYLKRHRRYFHLTNSWLSISRLLCGAALALLAAIQATASIRVEGPSTPVSRLFSKGTWAVSYLYAIVIMALSHRCDVSSPCIVFIFWMLALIAHVVPAYTEVILKTYEENMFDIVLVYLILFFLVVEFILQCVGDLEVTLVDKARVKRPCLSNKASFPSKLTYSWMFSLVHAGYKKTVQQDDLTDLPPVLQCRNILPEFLKSWTKELKRTAVKNRSSSVAQNGHAMYYSDSCETVVRPTEKTSLLHRPPNGYTHQGDEHPVSEKQKVKPSLWKVLIQVFYPQFLKTQMIQFIGDALQYASPLLLGQLIDYADNKEDYRQWQGFVLAASLCIVVFLNSLLLNLRFYNTFNIGMRVKTALRAAVFKKSLTMNAASRRQFTVGTMVNLMALDSLRFQESAMNMWVIFSMPLQVSLAFYFLYQQVGWAFLAGVGVLLLIIPFNAGASTLARKAAFKQIIHKDQRIKLMNEALNGIKVLKLYAWEASYQKKVEEIRQLEVNQLKIGAMYNAFNIWCWMLSTVLMVVCTFIALVWISPDSTLTPTKAFVSFSIYNLLQVPMNILPTFISGVVDCHVSGERIRNYLSGEDLDEFNSRSASEEYPVIVENGTFTWDRSIPPSLKKIVQAFDLNIESLSCFHACSVSFIIEFSASINVQVPKGALVAVIGQVGAGKSSLLSAMLGEMERESGTSSIRGSIAYVPQQAWIQNSSLRDNILFGKPLDQGRLTETIKACALETDLHTLPAGDLTEIGEKGMNLSGGQKQRISLGRAVYQDSDVYLLDDPLSAVDAHVGKHIFDKVIGSKGLLKNKTRILNTNGIHWLPLVDSIIVVDQGRISESGTYKELMGHDGPFSQLVKTFLLENDDEDTDDPEVLKLKEKVMEEIETVLSDEELHLFKRSSELKRSSEWKQSSSRKKDKSGARFVKSSEHVSLQSGELGGMQDEEDETVNNQGQLIQDERTETGMVKTQDILHIFRAVGCVWLGLIFTTLVTYNGMVVGAGIWLSKWTGDPYLRNLSNAGTDDYSSKTVLYISVYAFISFCLLLFNGAFIILLLVHFVNASNRMHRRMLTNILCQSMEFFDTTPIGRILNRFSRDVDDLDVSFGLQLRMVLQCLLRFVCIVVVITYSYPVFTVLGIPIFVVFVMYMIFYMPSSRQFRRLESITRSPMLSHFAETINGACSVRAYKVSDRFMDESIDLIDGNNQSSFIREAGVRWLRVRLEMLGNIVIMFTVLSAVVYSDTNGSLVGLSIAFALQITTNLSLLVQQFTVLESNAIAIERIVEYSTFPREPDWIIREQRPSFEWPENGKIEFVSYSTRYRSGLDLVLKSISFEVNAGEKIGIVGRTGAGKSSLSLALFRVIEAAMGTILIDGVVISTIGLHDLRSRLTILPQDPVLFSGSLRFNLDPFDLHSDDEVWSALDQAHIGKFVREFPGGLDYICEEDGQNLSVGQKQLVCLARSLLRKTKIIVLDEAAAALDVETDHLLQQTIREAFKDCTILTVAHRLNTVIDYDRILVLSDGQIVEFDTPTSLLKKTNGMFYGMAKEASLI